MIGNNLVRFKSRGRGRVFLAPGVDGPPGENEPLLGAFDSGDVGEYIFIVIQVYRHR